MYGLTKSEKVNSAKDKNVDTENGTENGTKIDNRTLILNILKEEPDITQNKLTEKTNISIRTVKRTIKELKEENLIERIGSDRKGYWKINI